jgi:hypothetical protein
MQHLIQTAIAVALLIGLPLLVPTPESEIGTLLAIVVALVLAAVAVRGVVRYVRSRKPKSYLDSVMPEQAVPPKVTVMEKPKE